MNAVVTADFQSLKQATGTKTHEAVGPVTTRLHPRVYGLTLGVYIALVAAFTFGFAGPQELTIQFGIVLAIAAASAVVPWMMAREGAKFWRKHDQADAPAGSFRSFLNGSIETASGRVSGRGAIALVLTVPVCLTLGVLAMAIIARVV